MNFKYDTSLGVAKATFLALGSLVFCAPAYAALHQYDVLVDSDNNASTGCAVTAPSAPSATASGVDFIVRARVSTNTLTASVIALEQLNCVSGSTFAAPVALAGAPYNLALGNGTSGATAIELTIPRSTILDNPDPTQPTLIRVGAVSLAADTSSDALLPLTLFQVAAGRPITNDAPAAPIPAASSGALALLALALLAIGGTLIRRYDAQTLKGSASAIVMVAFATVALLGGGKLAYAVVKDGLIADWLGDAPLISGSRGNAAPNADLVALFAKVDAGELAFRVDADVRLEPVVVVGNMPPVISGIANSALTLPANTLSLNPTVTDDGLPAPANLTYAWSVISGPRPVAFGTTVSAPPDLSTVANSTAAQTSNLRNPVAFFDFNGAGSYVLRLRASDGALETTRDITVNVTAQAAAAPSIGPFANRVMKLGETLSLGLAGQDANVSDHLTYNLIISPTGAALTPTGSPRFSFTPTAAQLGVQHATIEVRDAANQTAQASFTITVQAANRPPQFTAASKANGVATVGGAFTRTLIAADPDAGDTLSYSLIGGPSGLSVSPSGALSWTPSSGQRGNQVVKIAVSDGAGGADQAIFSVVVGNNVPPVAMDDVYQVKANTTLTVTPTNGVLANDIDPDTGTNAGLTAAKLTDPAIGTLSNFSSDGSFVYQAPATVPPDPFAMQKLWNAAHTTSWASHHELAADVNGDGYPDLIAHNSNDDIRALSGLDGSTLWHIDKSGAPDCALFWNNSGSPHRVLADIDDSGTPSLVFGTSCGRSPAPWPDHLIAYDNLGKVKWVSPSLSKTHPDVRYGTTPVPPGGFSPGGMATHRGLSVARLTASGPPVLLMRAHLDANDGYSAYYDSTNTVHYAGCRAATGLVADEGRACRVTLIISGIDGSVMQTLVAPSNQRGGFGGEPSGLWEMPPIAMDIDGDGRVDIVSGTEVWKQNASGGFDLAWQIDAPVNDTAVADLDGDGKAEIIHVRSSLTYQVNADTDLGIFIYSHDGQLKRRIPLGAGQITPLTIADVDGDGRPDIVIGAEGVLYAFRDDGRVIWAHTVESDVPTDPVLAPYYNEPPQGSRIANAAPQVYDLDGDGINEVVFNAYARTVVLNGRTGQRKTAPYWTFTSSLSEVSTLMLLDMNNDGRVDIVTNGSFSFNCYFTGFPADTCSRLIGPTVLSGGAGNTWNPGPKAYPNVQYRSTAIDSKARVLHDTTVSRVFRTPEQQGTVRDPRKVQSAQFTYQASDGSATSAAANVFIKIAPDNNPPVITSTPPRALLQKRDGAGLMFVYYYDVAAYDPDQGDSITYSLKNTSTRLVSIDAVTGRVRFEPPCNTECRWGWINVTVVATDSRGASTEQFFLLNLTNATASVPNVVGQLFDPALAALRGANLDGSRFTEFHSNQPVGTVLSQSPAAGVTVAEFDDVRLTVSIGPPPVIVPNVVDLAETLALTRLNALGFNVSVSRQFSNVPRGTAISQSLLAGNTVVPSAISIVVSGGTGLELKLSQAVVTGGESLTLLPAAFDAMGGAVALPALTYSLTPKQLPILGATPTVVGVTVSSSAATLGSFTVTATDAVGNRSASADFVVLKATTIDGKTNGAVIAHMLSVLSQMEALAPAMRAARTANDTAGMRTLLAQYVTTWRTVDVSRMKLTVPIALPVGFVPGEAEMTAFGLSPQPEDFLIQQVLREGSDDLRAWTGGLRASGTSMADLRDLADAFSTRASRINTLTISEYGGVMNHPEMIQLIAHDIPEFYEAFTDELAVVAGLPRRAPDYPNFKRARTEQKSTLAEVVVTQAVDMVIDKVMDQAAQTYKNAKTFAADTMKYAAYSAAIMATYAHLKEFAYGNDLVEVVSGASLSFRVFNAGYSFIEVASPTRRRSMFTGMVIGPSLFSDAFNGISDAVTKLKDAMSYGKDAATNPDRVKNGDDLFKIHDEFKEKVDSLINSSSNTINKATKQFYQSPNDIEHSCIFTATVPCQQLLYDDGFESVYEYAPPPGFVGVGGIPVPIVFIVQDAVTSDMYFGIKLFLPTIPGP